MIEMIYLGDIKDVWKVVRWVNGRELRVSGK